jgi:RimJ/RimL family protein N-acetyltransferase
VTGSPDAIETDRLDLRPLTLDDADEMVAVISDDRNLSATRNRPRRPMSLGKLNGLTSGTAQPKSLVRSI